MSASARFDTYRRFLGLSIAETAGVCGVRPRTVQRWIDEDRDIPDSAWTALDDITDAVGRAVDRIVNEAQRAGAHATLLRYRTAEAYAESPYAEQMPLGAHALFVTLAHRRLRKVEIQWGERVKNKGPAS